MLGFVIGFAGTAVVVIIAAAMLARALDWLFDVEESLT
jgi:hypothetical protein